MCHVEICILWKCDCEKIIFISDEMFAFNFRTQKYTKQQIQSIINY